MISLITVGVKNAVARVDQARWLKDLEQENTRLKKVVADLAQDKATLKGAVRGNF